MNESQSKRRMIENQVVFRKFNQRLQESIDNVNAIAAEEGEEPMMLDGDEPLFFCCECSDENCKKRIQVSPNDYNRIHKANDTFTIAPGHEVDSIEDVISSGDEYYVVRKHEQPPRDVDHLQKTPVNNVA